jgi:hypothetical protein
MTRQSATVECPTHPGSETCPIRVRYADAPGTFTRVDFTAGGFDCHLVQIQPTQDYSRMEVHFTGCQPMLNNFLRVLDIHDIKDESDLLSPFSGEYRQAGLFVGIAPAFLDEKALMARLRQTGRLVEFVDRLLAQKLERRSIAAAVSRSSK